MMDINLSFEVVGAALALLISLVTAVFTILKLNSESGKNRADAARSLVDSSLNLLTESQKQSQGDIDRLKLQLATQSRTIEQLHQTIAALRVEAETRARGYHSEINALMEKLNAQAVTIDDLNAAITKRDEQLLDMQSALRGREIWLSDMQTKLTASQQTSEKLRARVTELERKLAKLGHGTGALRDDEH